MTGKDDAPRLTFTKSVLDSFAEALDYPSHRLSKTFLHLDKNIA